jgi:plastocyanin
LPIADSIVPRPQLSSPPSSPQNSTVQNGTTTSQSVPAVILGIDGGDSYSPNPLEIDVGQSVTWYNGDTVSHTVTSGQDGDLDEGSLFDSDAIIPNQSYSLKFIEAGEFDYYCIYHPTMVGEVVVNEPSTFSPTSEDSSDEESEDSSDEESEDSSDEESEEE